MDASFQCFSERSEAAGGDMMDTADVLLLIVSCFVGSFCGGLAAILYLANWAGYGEDSSD